MSKIDLSIIIINYNTRQMTIDCLDKLIASRLHDKKIEVFLIDNASTDDSLIALRTYSKEHKEIPIYIIDNDLNMGFAAANNKAIRKASGDYILLLNSDVLIEKTTLSEQLKFMDNHSEYAISTCYLTLENGRIDPACHRGLPTPWASFCYFTKLESLFNKSKWFGQYHQTWKNLDTIHEVDVISGAFFFARKEIFSKIGLFDEGYFMYAEDIDLCLRIANQNFKIGFNPWVKAIHYKGQSGRKEQGNKAHYYFWQTMKLFYQKHYVKKYPKIIMWLIFKILDYKIKQYA